MANEARVYVKYGRRAHLLPWGMSPTVGSVPALCGYRPGRSSKRYPWLPCPGDEDLKQYDRAASLPVCVICETVRNTIKYMDDVNRGRWCR
jgi:hypothetical protein